MATITEVLELRSTIHTEGTIIDGQRTSLEAISTLALPQTHVQSSVSKLQVATIATQLSAINFFASFNGGMIVIGLPRIASDINLPSQLYLWPTSVFGLTSGATLLIAGSIADVIGSRNVDLVGCLLLGIFAVAGGLSTTGVQLVVFRALQGIAMSMHLPASVSIITQSVPSGKARNIAFSCLGLSQPLGFSFGLVLGGIFVDTVGWRVGFYIPAAITLALAVAGLWTLPKDPALEKGSLTKLWKDIDWIGAIIASTSLAMFSYVLAILSSDSSNIRTPSTIALLTISLILMPCFPIWINRQEKHSRPALIPNALWKNRAFTSICLMVLLSWAVMNSMELFCSLFFQEVQTLSPLQSSLRLLPSLIIGTGLNLTTGLFVDKAPAAYLIQSTSVLTAVSPLIMALLNPTWSYWHAAFFAQILEPMSADVLFTVGIIIVSDVFPEKTQALAGAVFSTVSQFGLSLGLSTMQIISNLVTQDTRYRDKASPQALLTGYQASFWAMFAGMIVCCGIAGFGLKKVGKVGLKRE